MNQRDRMEAAINDAYPSAVENLIKAGRVPTDDDLELAEQQVEHRREWAANAEAVLLVIQKARKMMQEA